MEIIITNKAAYVMIFFLVLAVVGMGVNARVDLSKAYHTLQDIVRSDDPTKSVDLMGDGIIDEADETLSVNWYNIKNFQKCDGLGNNGEEEIATGFTGAVLNCQTVGFKCTGLEVETDCIMQEGSSGNSIGTGLSTLQDFIPQHVIKDAGSLWVTLLPKDAQFEGGLAVNLACVSDGNCPSTTSMYNIPGPRQIATHNGETYVGTSQETPSGKFYKIGVGGCVAVTTNVDGINLGKTKGLIANAHGIFVLDELKDELNKYTLELIPVTKRSIPNPQYITEGMFGGKTKIIVVSQGETESHIKIYDAVTLSMEADLAVSEKLRGIDLDDVSKTLFLPREGEVLRYSLDYASGTYTLSGRKVLSIEAGGIKTLYVENGQLYLPFHLGNKISIYNAANTVPVHLADITTADLSGTMLTCDDATLCGATAQGYSYPPQVRSTIGMGITTTPKSWTYIVGVPGVCEFTCTEGKTYVPAANACGETWHLVGNGAGYNCATETELVTYNPILSGDACDTTTGDSIIFYCSNCNGDNTICDYNRFECKLN